MIADYLITNFTTLMILTVLCVTMFTNRNFNIPYSNLFNAFVILILVLTVFEYIELLATGKTGYIPRNLSLEDMIHIRLIASTAMYMIRPFTILVALVVLVTDTKKRILLAMPAVINALLFLPSAFGARFVFWIDQSNHWKATPLSNSIFIVQLVYVLVLLILSITQLKENNFNLSVILFTIVLLSFTIAVLEDKSTLTGYSTPVTTLCGLAYYIYLASMHRQQLSNKMILQEKQLAEDKLALLRSQIQPHFIYNSINIIRTLIRTDEARAVETIDDFSDYLRAHFRTIESGDMVAFETEIENIKAFLALAEADHTRDIQVVYDLKETDFRIPQLSLEPIVENAVKHGIDDDGGTITISSFRRDGCYIIRTTDSGRGEITITTDSKQGNTTNTTRSEQNDAANVTDSEQDKSTNAMNSRQDDAANDTCPVQNETTISMNVESDRLAVGIANTRKRLELLCGGRLEVNITPEGTIADIIIPAEHDTPPSLKYV